MPRTSFTGPNLNQLGEKLQAQADAKRFQAIFALAQAVDAGTLRLQDALEEAVTKTGLAREAMDEGFPGRHLTGQMVGSISNNTEAPEYDGNRTIMALGWFAGEFQQYFEDQDLRIGGPERGAHAMFQAQEEVHRVMDSLMGAWMKGDLNFDD